MIASAKATATPTRHLGWSLRDEHSTDFLRLQRVLKTGHGFRLILCLFNAPRYRGRVITQVNAAVQSPAVWHLPTDPDPTLFEAALPEQSSGHGCLHVIGLDHWLTRDHEGVLRLLNYHREQIVELAALPLLFWISPAQVPAFAREAPDMWAWRAAVLDFTLDVQPQPNYPIGPRFDLGSTGTEKMRERVAEINAYLATRPQPTNADANLLLEAAVIALQLGNWVESNACAERALTVYQAANNRRGVAVALGRIADVLQARGKFDDALRIRRKQQLPIFDRLSDARGRAYTLGKIADILEIRGEWDEALHIRRNEELPAYIRFGDEHTQAVALAKIADILERRGDPDEARRIHQDEVLPLFERLGSSRDRAITLAKIAGSDRARGNQDGALRILRDDVLPIFQRLGDVRSQAVTLGQIAEILQAKGDLDAALRVFRDESLEILRRVGDERACALTWGRIAHILQTQGESDEAIRIRRDEELPVYSRLEDLHGLLDSQANIALMLLSRAADGPEGTGERAEAEALLCQSLSYARHLAIPAAIESIEGIIAKHGLHCPAT